MNIYWKWPASAQKAHVFIDGRSLCGKWMVLSDANSDAVSETDTLGRDDCSPCFKKAQRMGLIAKKVQP